MKGACQCGAVSVSVPGRPDYLNQCNCTFCTKLGAMWGYYAPREVSIDGTPRAYQRGDVEQPSITAHFCGECGAAIDWTPVDPGSDRMGVNMRLFDPEELAGVEVRYGDWRHFGKEPRHFYREPTRFGDRDTGA